MVNSVIFTTKKLVNSLKKHYGNCTNYALAKNLGVSKGAVLNWDGKGTSMNDDIALKAAQILGLNPEKVLIDLQVERTKGSDSAALWQHISKQFSAAAA